MPWIEVGLRGLLLVYERFHRKTRRKKKPVINPDEYLSALEHLARQHCCTLEQPRGYDLRREGTLLTDSGFHPAHTEALWLLARAGRFRIVEDGEGMVVGYWPENDPEAANKSG
jgi:hypothetical protein